MRKDLFQTMLVTVAALSFLFGGINVLAEEEPYYLNNNGVAMSEQQFNKLSSIFHISYIENFTQDEFDKYVNGEIIDSKTIYYKTITQDGAVINETEVSKEEYDNAPSSLYSCSESTRGSDSGFIETSYKRMRSTLVDLSSGYSFSNMLEWKQVPSTRSFDVIAFRTKRMSFSNVEGVQTYYVGNNSSAINYNTNSAGYKSASNGAGISMNLKDDSNITTFLIALVADMQISNYDYSNAYVYTTYQHAQSSLTRAQSMSYTLQAGGLGDVLYYSNTSIRNKYDDMPGIMLVIPVP